MEKFFIVTDQSPLHKDYYEWENNSEQIRIIVQQFFKDNDIESILYGFYRGSLCIIPTENDLIKFNNVLGKDVGDKLRPFKGNSKIQKLWENTLKENNFVRKGKPHVPMYFSDCYGKMSSRIIDIDDILYCSYKNECDFNTPEGMIEIKASKFWEVIENEEERRESIK